MEESIVINGVEFVKKPAVDEKQYVIVRTRHAGVHAGYLIGSNGQETRLMQSRRIWYWDGAASLSQLAMEGVSKPNNCKFSMPVDEITVFETIEIITVTDAAKKIIESVPVWKA